MDLALALLAGFVGGLIAVGIVAFVLYRKLKASPQYQMMQGMSSMMGMPPGMEPRGFKKYGK